MNDEPQFVEADVTCHANECVNAEVTVRVLVIADPAARYVVCGPCGGVLDDVTVP